MKTRLLFILALATLASACSEHSCPAYGSRSSYAYSYKPAKKKAFKTKSNASSKRAKKAEQE